MKTEQLQLKLQKYLMKHQKTLGRDGKIVLRLAEKTGLSKHTIQSIAMERRTPSAKTADMINEAMKTCHG